MDRATRMPRIGGRLFLGDGGLETTMIFAEGIELPDFASFLLLEDERRREALHRYYCSYIDVARRFCAGSTLDTPTWRANAEWGRRLGYSTTDLGRVNREAVAFAEEIRAKKEGSGTPIAICGTIGPRGDAYHPTTRMSAREAERYHAVQIGTFAQSGVDMVGAYTLAYADEAIGIVCAAGSAGIPVTIAFTVEVDGRLPSGQPLGEAIEQVDAETDRAAAFFLINCAHPIYFAGAVEQGGPWLDRLGGIRANASRKSHAQLECATELDGGDPDELATAYRRLKPYLPALTILGGCCGTNPRHVERISAEWLAGSSSRANAFSERT